jgi:hypothetical protein
MIQQVFNIYTYNDDEKIFYDKNTDIYNVCVNHNPTNTVAS